MALNEAGDTALADRAAPGAASGAARRLTDADAPLDPPYEMWPTIFPPTCASSPHALKRATSTTGSCSKAGSAGDDDQQSGLP